ncbi:MAG: site-2 protease family protein [Clostridia bacterium]|nr:site-2 protease family protein [Clostridia bacterium]
MWNVFITVLSTVIVFGVLIFIHEFGHFITARVCGVGVKEFAIGMGPRLFSWTSKKYGTRYGVRALPIGGFVSMVGEDEASDDESAFCNKSIWKRMLIVVAGAAMNLILGFILMAVIVFSQSALASTTIAEFNENAISNEFLEVGDVITAVDGVPVFTGNDAAYEIMNQGYEPIDITVKRNGEKITFKDVTFGSFTEDGVEFGDYDFKFLAEQKTLPNLLKHTFWRSLSTVKMVIDSVVSLITGRYGFEAVSGPVGVAETVGDAARSGITNLLYIVAVLSVNLGVFNLIPFPALDGGRALFLVIEAIRRKPIKKEVESYINFIGISILFAFMIFIMGKDIIELFRR